jgi:hypothetical protein
VSELKPENIAEFLKYLIFTLAENINNIQKPDKKEDLFEKVNLI